jgi:hypothetical protein
LQQSQKDHRSWAQRTAECQVLAGLFFHSSSHFSTKKDCVLFQPGASIR